MPFLNAYWSAITQIEVSDTPDVWIWTESSNGIFSFCTAWNQIRDIRMPFPYYDLVWFNSASPKMSVCLLKGLLDRLPTRARLKKFQIIEADSCVLCGLGVETIEHLYFNCSYSSYLWAICKLKLELPSSPMGTIKAEADLIKAKFKTKDKTYKVARHAFVCTVWHIFQERNRRIFQRTQMNKIMVFRRIYEDIHILMRTCDWKVNRKGAMLSNWGI